MRGMLVRAGVAAAGIVLALASAAWLDPAAWSTYAVFLALAFAFSFVWVDSDAPTSVPHRATTTAFVYIAGPPILFLEGVAAVAAYPLLFAAARRGLVTLPRPLRPLAKGDAAAARRAVLELAAMQGLATIGSATRVAVVQLAHAAGVQSLIATIALGEPIAYASMALVSAGLALPTARYVRAAPQRLPADDERVDVMFASLLIVPLVVLLIAFGWLEHGLAGAAAWSLTALVPHALVQLLVRRRHLLAERQAELEQANASLERKQAELEALAHAVTHDIRDPLIGIRATADDVLGRGLADGARGDLLVILRTATKTEAMVTDLLRMVAIVSEPEPVTMVDLGALTADVLEQLHPLTMRSVTIDLTTPLPAIPGQATKLRHVIANLVGNAIRFVPPGMGRIGISAPREGESVVLAVRDNGVGIPAEHHRDIFEIFKRVPRNGGGEQDGTGMGLAIVKRIVEAHGGEVWVESAPGKGSVFRVRLPAG